MKNPTHNPWMTCSWLPFMCDGTIHCLSSLNITEYALSHFAHCSCFTRLFLIPSLCRNLFFSSNVLLSLVRRHFCCCSALIFNFCAFSYSFGLDVLCPLVWLCKSLTHPFLCGFPCNGTRCVNLLLKDDTLFQSHRHCPKLALSCRDTICFGSQLMEPCVRP